LKIDIDNRERHRIPKFQNYIKSGKAKFIKGATLLNMPTGDYGTKDHLVGIEYKKDDLAESIFSELIDKQLKELSEAYEHAYLFIGYDGIEEMISENLGVNPDCLIGKMTSILSRNHVSVVFVGDLLVRFVIDTIEKHYDGRNPTKEYSVIRKGYQKRKPSVIEIKLDIISRIPGLGMGKGNLLLEHFDNKFSKISNASVEEVMEVPRIGEVLAKRIKEVME